MELELIRWKTREKPTVAREWPCMFCGSLATHFRILRDGLVTVKLITCLACGTAPDAILWDLLNSGSKESPLDRILQQIMKKEVK